MSFPRIQSAVQAKKTVHHLIWMGFQLHGWLERQKKARGSKTGTRKTAAMKIKTKPPSPRKRALATASQAKKRFWGHGRKGPRKEGSVVDLTK